MASEFSAFSPAHITGIFTIEGGSSNGAGFTLSHGMKTKVRIDSEKGNCTKILISGKKSSAPVSREVLSSFRKLTGSSASLSISHSPDFPIGFGLGMSAAGALSLSLALNKSLEAGLTRDACARLGFSAEVKCGTGLSAIFAEQIGGFITRNKLGGEIVRLKLSASERKMPVVCAFLSPIRTASIIRNASWKRKINLAGKEALKNFFADKSLENFISQSREFALKSGLPTPAVRKLLAANPNASMAMLGETVFAFTDEPEKTAKAFKRACKDVRISRIGQTGARLL